MCFGSLSCCRTQVRFSLRSRNRWPDILLQDFLAVSRIHGSSYHSKSSRSWSSKTAPDHRTTTTIFYCWYNVLFLKCCVTLTPDVMGQTPSKKLNFCLISPLSTFPKVLGIIKRSSGKTETSLCFFCSPVVFVLELCHAGHFGPVSVFWGSHEHWP